MSEQRPEENAAAYPPPATYAQPGYAQPTPPAYQANQPYGGYPQPHSAPGSSIALVVLSAFFAIFGLLGVPSLVCGIVALSKSRSNPAECQRWTKGGWIVLGALLGLALLIITLFVALAFVSSNGGDDSTTIGTLNPLSQLSQFGRHGTTIGLQALRST